MGEEQQLWVVVQFVPLPSEGSLDDQWWSDLLSSDSSKLTGKGIA